MPINIDRILFDNLTTVQRDALTTPAKGTVIFNLTTNQLEVNKGTGGAPTWESATDETLSEVLANGNSSGANDISMDNLKGIILGVAGNRLDASGNNVTLDVVAEFILKVAALQLVFNGVGGQILIKPDSSTTTLQTSLVNTRTSLNVQGNGAMNARIQTTYGNVVNAYMQWEQAAANTQFNFGPSIVSFIINGSKSDTNTIIRGKTDNNLLFADALLDAIGIGSAPNSVAKLDVSSTTKGVLWPRMTAAEASAITPAEGLMLFVTTTDATFTSVGYWVYESAAWAKMTTAGVVTNNRASAYISASTATTISFVNTPVKVGATTYVTENLSNFDSPAAGRLRYTATPDTIVTVGAAISMTGGNNDTYSFFIAKNGTVLTQTRVQRKLSAGADVGALAVLGSVSMSTNDYVEIFVENNTNTDNVTAEYMYISVH